MKQLVLGQTFHPTFHGDIGELKSSQISKEITFTFRMFKCLIKFINVCQTNAFFSITSEHTASN